MREHAMLAELLDQTIFALESDCEADAGEKWDRFRVGLLAHLATEDSQLIPALPRVYEMNARVLGQEHQHIRDRVTELNAKGACNRRCLSELRVLRYVLAAHTRNDDRLLYAWAEAHLDATTRTRLLEALVARLDPSACAPTARSPGSGT